MTEPGTSSDAESSGNRAILHIRAGLGGGESRAWAQMLQQMYARWAERHEHGVQVLHVEEADPGIEAVDLLIEGAGVCSILALERGVHRLIRVSPFDVNGRRHTSFVQVMVAPDLDADPPLDQAELRIDIIRAPSDPGASAADPSVRVTHLPTRLAAISCLEATQTANRSVAMRILRAQLWAHRRQDTPEAASWGSQIRTYTLDPQRQVVDHRTGLTTTDADAVLDGDLRPFIEA